MQEMATPILFMFLLFPVIAIATQFGRVHGIACFVVEIAIVVLSMNVWPDQFPGALAMAAGVLMLLGFSLAKDVRERRTARPRAPRRKRTRPGPRPFRRTASPPGTRSRRCSARTPSGSAATCRGSRCSAPPSPRW